MKLHNSFPLLAYYINFTGYTQWMNAKNAFSENEIEANAQNFLQKKKEIFLNLNQRLRS